MNQQNEKYDYWPFEGLDCWSLKAPLKTELLREYGKKYGLRRFIETGTAQGDTVAGLQNDFDTLYSIEFADNYFDIASNRFRGIKKINILKGDSGKVLENLLSALPAVPTLFWLDAHADNKSPLEQELNAIFKNNQMSRQNDVILIDDLQGFWNNDWPEVAARVVDAAGWQRETIDGIMRVIKEPS